MTYLPEITRKLPSAVDSEKGVLGSLLALPVSSYDICRERGVTWEWFHVPAHQTIYSVIGEMVDAGTPVDLITLTTTLTQKGQLDLCGGPAYLTELSLHPTAAHLVPYLDGVQDAHLRREVIVRCTKHAASAYFPGGDAESMIDELEADVLAIRGNGRSGTREILPMAGAMGAVAAIESLVERRGKILGLSTGFSELDSMIDGLQPKEMFVIAARPSMGKTALAMNIAEHVALVEKKPVAVFSVEMSGEQLHRRLLCSVAKVSYHRIRDGDIRERDFPALTYAATKIAASKLIVVDSMGDSIGDVRARARRLHRQHGLAAIFVDYLQLLKSSSRRAQDNRQLEIAEISSGLKAMAKELNLPVVVLAQLNRNPESRGGAIKGRPMLSDLRESGSIEQDADTVGLLMRDEYYATTDEEREELAGRATLIIAKQRNGPVGDVALTFLKEFTRFENRAKQSDQPAENSGVPVRRSYPPKRNCDAEGAN